MSERPRLARNAGGEMRSCGGRELDRAPVGCHDWIMAAWDRAYVQVYTGDGKGKTTAALGLALRAAGAGRRVFFAQFAKGREASELVSLARFADHVIVLHAGKVVASGKPGQVVKISPYFRAMKGA